MDDQVKEGDSGVEPVEAAFVEPQVGLVPDTKVPALATDIHGKVSGLYLGLNLQKGTVLSDIATLIESDSLDEIDLRLISEAVAFIENPTDDLSEITGITISVERLIGCNDAQGENSPPALDAMHAYLLSLRCINRINFIEKEMAGATSVSKEVSDAIILVIDWAKILSRAYKQDALLSIARELAARLNSKKDSERVDV